MDSLIVYPLTGLSESAVSPCEHISEAVRLAQSIGLSVIFSEIIPCRRVRASTLLGEGILERLREVLSDHKRAYCESLDILECVAEDEGYISPLLIMDCSLTAGQQRNLERSLGIKVIDRSGLILDIFGARARTYEGKLQVELASLNFQRSRLVRSWTHLERQRGGFGFLGGPGESQLELDKRMLLRRVRYIEKSLERVRNTRSLQRRNRERVRLPVVALVGYTNAGKSTLFRRLSSVDTYVADRLFATLDSFMRKVLLADGREIILVDTVGFISDLPPQLIAAFRATLEEAENADLLLHVADISSGYVDEQRAEVDSILSSLDLCDGQQRLLVLNKSDLVSGIGDRDDIGAGVVVSAESGVGCDYLLERIGFMLGGERKAYRLRVGFGDGGAYAWLFAHSEVCFVGDDSAEQMFDFRIRMCDSEFTMFQHKFGDIEITSDVS